MSPYDILRHYCDLNDIPYHTSRDSVIDYIVQNPLYIIVYATPYARIFDIIHQFIKDEIDLETLMARWDMNHAYDITLVISPSANCLVYDSLVVEQIWDKYNTMIKIL